MYAKYFYYFNCFNYFVSSTFTCITGISQVPFVQREIGKDGFIRELNTIPKSLTYKRELNTIPQAKKGSWIQSQGVEYNPKEPNTEKGVEYNPIEFNTL